MPGGRRANWAAGDAAGRQAAYGVLNTSTGTHAEDNPLRYTGAYLDKFWDLGSGFTKLGTRWNNTAEGRFTQQDSQSFLADPANGNRYAYAGSNPVNNIDPTGLVTRTQINTIIATSICAVGSLILGFAGGLAAIVLATGCLIIAIGDTLTS